VIPKRERERERKRKCAENEPTGLLDMPLTARRGSISHNQKPNTSDEPIRELREKNQRERGRKRKEKRKKEAGQRDIEGADGRAACSSQPE